MAVLLLGWWPFAADGVHRLDAGDDGAVVEAEVGERVSLELEGNPTTGYAWEVTAIDPAVLAQAGEPEYQSSSDADGAGGTYTFHFNVVGAGETGGGVAVLPLLGGAHGHRRAVRLHPERCYPRRVGCAPPPARR